MSESVCAHCTRLSTRVLILGQNFGFGMHLEKSGGTLTLVWWVPWDSKISMKGSYLIIFVVNSIEIVVKTFNLGNLRWFPSFKVVWYPWLKNPNGAPENQMMHWVILIFQPSWQTMIYFDILWFILLFVIWKTKRTYKEV